MSTQVQSVGLGKAFGLILGSVVAIILFIPRLINLAGKAVDVADDVMDSGKALSETLKASAIDFKNTSALEAEATFQSRMKEINDAREAVGLQATTATTKRTAVLDLN